MKLEDLKALEDQALDDALEVHHPEAQPSPVPRSFSTTVTFREDEIFKFICGTAGTGKTFAVRELAERDPRVYLCATTGIAAVNLGGNATTINAALKYFDTDSLIEKGILLDERFIKWARAGKTHWILDEASMLDGRQLICLVKSIEAVNESLESYKTYDGPPVRLTLTGDFAQLPPVKAKFAFEVDVWDRFESNTTVLKEIRRQTDRDFLEALQHARVGNGLKALEYFRQFIVPNRDLDFDGVTVVARNAQVDRHNEIKLDEIQAERAKYRKHMEGQLRPEWKTQIPDQVELKEGATVMILANEYDVEDDEYVYVNGDIGKITRLGTGGATVKLYREDRSVYVKYVTRYATEINESGKEERVGSVTYLPLRVAYATTVHKVQGLTMDHCQVCFNDRFFVTPGMLYVALSRVRSPQGLRLVGNPDLFEKRCTADERVRRWL